MRVRATAENGGAAMTTPMIMSIAAAMSASAIRVIFLAVR